jgi:hypothetical protein
MLCLENHPVRAKEELGHVVSLEQRFLPSASRFPAEETRSFNSFSTNEFRNKTASF